MPNNTPLSGEFVLSPEKDTPPTTPAVAEAVSATSSIPDANKHNHTHSRMHFFSSLGHYPENVTFLDQEADEEVVLVVRRDFITNLPWILSIILLTLVPPVLLFLVPIFIPSIFVSGSIITLAIVFYYLVVFGFGLLYFTIWYFNVGIVTNKRIIDIDVPNILVRHLSEARLSTIVDVSLTQVGGIRSFFDYGNIDIQTEAITQNIEFDRAPNPNLIRKVIGELIVNKPEA